MARGGNCADCGGFDVEWMRFCSTHEVEYCRGCDCPYCAEEELDDYEIDMDGCPTQYGVPQTPNEDGGTLPPQPTP